MKNTIVLYSTKNEKDALCIESMFRGYDMQEIYTLKPNITSEYMHVYTWNYNQIIIYGTDIVMIETIEYIISKNKEREEKDKFKVKVISEIYEGTLFYDRERSSFLKCIELLKEKEIYKMYFLKKGIYEAYLNMGYNVRIFNA